MPSILLGDVDRLGGRAKHAERSEALDASRHGGSGKGGKAIWENIIQGMGLGVSA